MEGEPERQEFYIYSSFIICKCLDQSFWNWADTVLDDKDGNTLVGWDRVSEENTKSTRESKANTVTVTFLSLICLTRIFAHAYPELECKSSLVTRMPDDSIFALEHKDMIQKIGVKSKKELKHTLKLSKCTILFYTYSCIYEVARFDQFLSTLFHDITHTKIFKMLWHWFSRLKKNFTDIIQIQ